MQAEEAVLQFVACGEFIFHQRVNPGGSMVLVAVTVLLVVHDLACMDLLQVINLPEDHPTLLRCAQPISVRGRHELDLREVAFRDNGFTEYGIYGQALLD